MSVGHASDVVSVLEKHGCSRAATSSRVNARAC